MTERDTSYQAPALDTSSMRGTQPEARVDQIVEPTDADAVLTEIKQQGLSAITPSKHDSRTDIKLPTLSRRTGPQAGAATKPADWDDLDRYQEG